jgi:uncharacterized lipoprotein YddW (UPF0748 family)
MNKKLIVLLLTLLLAMVLMTVAQAQGSTEKAPSREFRGAWIATIFNLDWPNTRSGSVGKQKQELIAMLDMATALNLNAVVFQIRPEGDALYDSKYEPWSAWLTGEQGKAPEPYWDPLEFVVEEGHARCLEVHAWMNPYRVATNKDTPKAPDHVYNTNRDLVVVYDKLLVLDPAKKESTDYLLKIVKDVVQRYDIDGIHFDDYFYPYPKAGVEFPDQHEYDAYKAAGGTLSKADWRRENVDNMVKKVNETIQEEKPWVKFGISPFGIWKSGTPAGIAGLSSYNTLYSDSRKWLQEGWVDYLAPQLYWNVDAQRQSYTRLMEWWLEQNTQNRHLYGGTNVVKPAVNAAAPSAEEILNRINVTREKGSPGNIFYSFKGLMNNKTMAETLKSKAYPRPALMPLMPWKPSIPPSKPENFKVKKIANSWELAWDSPDDAKIWHYALYRKTAADTLELIKVMPANQTQVKITADEILVSSPEFVLSSVDRLANESPRIEAVKK